MQLHSSEGAKKRELEWTNLSFISFSHLMAAGGIVWLAMSWHWQTAAFGLLWFAFCGLGITGGYHRLFAHPTYSCIWPLRLFYLLFGAASVQNSALKWCADHRIHHRKVDTDDDPYDITQGFWWAHIGWVLHKERVQFDTSAVKDLNRDPLIRFQHRWYVPLAFLMGAIVPMAVGFLWGDPIGTLLVAGFLRLVLQWHATFSVNSFAHYIGSQPYGTENTSRDSWITAIITLGEGYHNFHHRFQSDYRNGVRWFHMDPTKWFVWTMSKVRVTRGLKRVSKQAIQNARAESRLARATA